jgi:Uncharacterised nucleotidyltransferase
MHSDLLAVAFSDPASAVEKWTALRSRFVLDEIEPGVFALLPLVYRRLMEGGYEDSLGPRLKGIVRKTWVLNNLLLEQSNEVGRELRDAGLQAMFVEGPVLAKRFYPDLAMRPSSYFDVLVDSNDVEKALAPLAALGWRADPDVLTPRKDRRGLVNEHGHRGVVRTSLSVDFTGPKGRRRAHAPLWDGAERLQDGESDLLVPSRTDCMLAVCVTHARAESISGPQWVADAKMLLEGDIDWPRLISGARGGGQTLRLTEALAYLADTVGPRPPSDVLEQLSTVRVSRRERFVHECTAGRFRRTGALPRLVAEHLSESADKSLLRAAVSFPAHLRDRWRLSHVWQVPMAAGRRALRLLTRRSGAAV